MKKEGIIKYFCIAAIIVSLIGIFILYKGGFTGKVISDEINGSFINLTSYDINFNKNSAKNSDGLKIEKIRQFKKFLNISYSFDNSNFIGNEQAVELWIINENGTEIKRSQDIFPMNKEGLIEREVSIDLGENTNGNYHVYIALSSNSNNFIDEKISLTGSITGKTILENQKPKYIGYVFFLLIILAGIVFIFRSRNKDESE